MKTINFIAGGMMGDFIHSMYVVKNICAKHNIKACVQLVDAGDTWRYGIEKAFTDLNLLMLTQPFVEQFSNFTVMGKLFKETINLNDWRKTVSHTHATTGRYDTCWSELLSKIYDFDIPAEYKWLEVCNPFPGLPDNPGSVIIHRSIHHHNPSFPWQTILDKLSETEEQIFFVSSNPDDWEHFPYKKHENMDIGFYPAKTIFDMAKFINDAKLFIGNQSAPFALASALDVPRLCELDGDPAPFYMGEEKYSANISWYLNNETKYFAPNSIIQL